MKSLHDVWALRLEKYTKEVQNYLKFIFTGHIAVVLLFALGAAGYAYSDWVQSVPESFPGAWICAVIFALLLAYSPPVTLLKRADSVYFLPLESRLDELFNPALKWTFFSQLYLPVFAFIVALPLLNALYGLPSSLLIGLPIFLLLLKWWNVQTEFAFGRAYGGAHVWRDRLLRFATVLFFIYFYITGNLLVAVLFLFVVILYGKWTKRQAIGKAFPYEHFISLEEGRMSRFYHFANYFTDVPHLSGKVRRRAWLDWVYKPLKKGPQSAHAYLVWRTWIRSDELLYLWIRLTAILLVAAWFIPFMWAVLVFAGALAFASTIQIWQSMNREQHFRMDQLFPLSAWSRGTAVKQLISRVQVLQAILVGGLLAATGNWLTGLLASVLILVVSFGTLVMAKK
ncbi:ABC transporter permease [Planomicrobium sp. YIM 101495]|uniref:ABC transporter permease n=1 Tax=Planomicrobium sp. YIM 101495 TaxID=2665160 RepID=UPI0012B77D2F|nr:ABC transporter permease [Planomicrobium sp. YIM 101495]MTD31640.1 protein EcsB [Planomicrobium sp. YIM 101495]